MGLLRDAIGSALGANQVKNGFNGPKIPFVNNNTDGHRRVSENDRLADTRRCPRSPDSRNSYRSHSSSMDQCSTSETRQSNIDISSQHSLPPPYRESHEDLIYNDVSVETNRLHPYSNQSQSTAHSMPKLAAYRDPSPIQQAPQPSGFRPLALPQITHGKGQPFLRGYSTELMRYGITEQAFIQSLDAINIAIIPNPEVQLFQKGADIAGWFVPGAGAIGLMAGQVGVGAAAAFGHASLLARNLSKSNLELFVPNGLEICIGKAKDVDDETGIHSYAPMRQQQTSSESSPQERLASYGDLLAPVSVILPPLENAGRNDPIAMLGRGMASRDAQRKTKRAQGRMAKGKSRNWDKLEQELEWIIVRRATPDAVTHWQRTLQKSNDELGQSQTGTVAFNETSKTR